MDLVKIITLVWFPQPNGGLLTHWLLNIFTCAINNDHRSIEVKR